MQLQPKSKVTLKLSAEIDSLLNRCLPDGGFSEVPGGAYRPEATAWAILCLEALQIYPKIVAGAKHKLVDSQLPDGRIPLTSDHHEAFWPTAVAVMALHGSHEYVLAHYKAINFLLSSTGNISEKELQSVLGHDPTIPGWSWIDQTHSWVEPTAMAIRALSLAGKSQHERVQLGIRLLLDRQLPNGGWNYGNTTVYGKTLNAMPASTGMALWSLASLSELDKVRNSLNLLQQQLPGLHTPLSLGWALLGLKAWNTPTPQGGELIMDCLQRQGRYSTYGTSQLSILLIASGFIIEASKNDA